MPFKAHYCKLRTMDLAKKAIQAALQQQWKKAIKINENLLKNNPQDPKTLNRLAHAFFKTNQIKKTKKLYRQVLKIDAVNLIAQRNLEKLDQVRTSRKTGGKKIYPSFIREPGKTKTFSLLKLASQDKLAPLEIGDPLQFKTRKRSISLTDSKGQYLGVLPDDIAKHLLFLIKRGNKYEIFVRLVEKNRLVVFIKEIFRSKRNQNLVSFQ